eukprot:5079367-Lingulodinium_polyedra.AAC.1
MRAARAQNLGQRHTRAAARTAWRRRTSRPTRVTRGTERPQTVTAYHASERAPRSQPYSFMTAASSSAP